MIQKKPADIMLFWSTIALLVIGIFMVYDASYAVAGQTYGNPEFFYYRQAMFAVVGALAMFLVMRIPYWKLRPFALALLIISIIGLLLVLVPGIGRTVNGAKRWIGFGSFTVQPSEFAKLCLVIYLASVFAARAKGIRELGNLVLLLIPVGLVGLLIVIEDMGTAIVVLSTALVMFYMAGARFSHLAGIVGVAVPIGAVFVLMETYRIQRMIAFLDPFKDYHGIGYQVCQSLIALGSGGPLGVGLCDSRQKLFYLPAQHTDFIFAVLGEETGLLGTLLVAGLFLLMAYRGFVIARNTRDLFGKHLAAGISVMIGGQALLNMLVVTSAVPATGVPLPFISYGGSSLVLNLMCVGVLLGVSQYPKAPESYEYEDRTDRRRNRRPRVSRPQRRRGATGRVS